ncbi:MAG: deoxynucleoside kinase [candidate division Zixibacteria bacterium]|nr:deoxynucleoside kinase [candidate division Zixibacteria bacterium]
MSHGTSEPNYIAVEGVIGVGKTSFAKMLADRLEATLVNEEVFENPFLVDFYKNKTRYALSCQLFFLISRFQQQQQLMVRDLFAQRIVADYLFAKDSIFASVNLSERELALYNRIAPVLARDIPKPDLVIYLQASSPVLLERIRSRSFTFEKPIDLDYVEGLNKAYDYYFFHYTETPLLVVKTDEIDFVHNVDHFDDLIEQLRKPIVGKKYYVPAGDLSRK